MFDLDTCVCFITNKEAKKLSEAFNTHLHPLGVTRVQWIAMYYISKEGKLTQNELAEKLEVKPSSIVRLIDRMERDDYVERIKSKEDRRITYIQFTETGKVFWEKLLPEGEKMSKIFSKGISEEDLVTFKKVLNKMVENIL